MSGGGRAGLSVVVVDDEWWSRAGIVSALRASGMVGRVAEAENARDAFELTRLLDPHIVVVDLMIPQSPGLARSLAGLDLVAELARTQRFGRPRVLVLTSFDHHQHVLTAVKAGAAGYLVKGATGPRDLPGILNRLMQGEKVVQPDGDFATVFGDRVVHLSATERRLLPEVCSGDGYRAIAERLGYSHQHVKATAATICRKFGVKNRTQLVVAAKDSGLLQ